MDIRQFSYFCTIYEETSMTSAAEKLHVSQPTLSNQLKILEEELGFTLFERRNRKLFPTEEGELLYKNAKILQSNYDSLLQTFHDLKEGIYDTLHIGCICSLAILVFPDIMTAYLEQNPRCKLHVYENNTSNLKALLDEGKIDLCVIKGSIDSSVYCSLSLDGIFHSEGDCLAAVGLPSYLKSFSDSIPFSRLKDTPLILQRTHEQSISNAFGLHNMIPNIISSHENVISAMSWSVHGMGVAIMPYSSTKLISYVPDGNTLTVKKLMDPSISCQTNLVWRRDHKLNLATQRFIEYIEKTARASRHLNC